jgi:hypothetical protein
MQEQADTSRRRISAGQAGTKAGVAGQGSSKDRGYTTSRIVPSQRNRFTRQP